MPVWQKSTEQLKCDKLWETFWSHVVKVSQKKVSHMLTWLDDIHFNIRWQISFLWFFGPISRPYTHVRTCVPQKSKNIYFYFIYFFIWLIYLFIGFLPKGDLYTCKSFLLYCFYFTKHKLCEYCTIHFNMHKFKTLSSQPQ